METIGFISAIIALILGLGFIFYSNELGKEGENKNVENKTIHDKKNTFGGTIITLLFFVFVITIILSTFSSCTGWK